MLIYLYVLVVDHILKVARATNASTDSLTSHTVNRAGAARKVLRSRFAIKKTNRAIAKRMFFREALVIDVSMAHTIYKIPIQMVALSASALKRHHAVIEHSCDLSMLACLKMFRSQR